MPAMYKLPEPMPYFPNEVFVDVALSEIPEGFNHHKVSNYGRVYDCRKEQFCNLHLDSKGYLYIIAAYNGGKMYPRVHRLVLASFNYIDGCKEMIVNHLDGIKYHNYLWNLEWTDYSGNAKHAYATGLINNKQGEDRVMATITNNQAREICEYLQSGLGPNEISNITGVSPHTISSIKLHRAWNSISKDYVFPEREPNIFTDDQVNMICNLFEKNPIPNCCIKREYYTDILNMCGIEPTKQILDNMVNIHNRRSYKKISKNYNF
jgi:hypothetical protein